MPINPFADLLRPYFDLISQDFEHFANEAVLNNVTPDDIARSFLSDSRLRASFNKYMMPELESKISREDSNVVLRPIQNLGDAILSEGGNRGGARQRHQEQLQVLNQTLLRELALSVPTLLLSIAGAMQPLLGSMLPSWLPVAATVGGAVSLKDVISSTASHISERRRLGKNPIGILWHARGPT